MKNKKGFTLIELLAVITILGIILTIATTSVINSIKTSKEKKKEIAAQEIVNMAEAYFAENTDIVGVNACELKNEGYLEDGATNPMTGKSFDDTTCKNVYVQKANVVKGEYDSNNAANNYDGLYLKSSVGKFPEKLEKKFMNDDFKLSEQGEIIVNLYNETGEVKKNLTTNNTNYLYEDNKIKYYDLTSEKFEDSKYELDNGSDNIKFENSLLDFELYKNVRCKNKYTLFYFGDVLVGKTYDKNFEIDINEMKKEILDNNKIPNEKIKVEDLINKDYLALEKKLDYSYGFINNNICSVEKLNPNEVKFIECE